VLPENDFRNSFQPPMLEFVPTDTLRAIHNLRLTHIGVPLNPPLPAALIDLLDVANGAEHQAENLIADLELLALKRGAIRKQIISEERKNRSEGKKSVLSKVTSEQRRMDEEIQVLSAQVTLACEDASGAKANIRSRLPELWPEWHSDLAKAVVKLRREVQGKRDEVANLIHALKTVTTQLAVVDSRYAPLTEKTRSGLTARNVAKTARETYNDAFTTTLFHLERLAFDLPERTQPAQWLDWALEAVSATKETSGGAGSEAADRGSRD
jgi:hypothetical protein